MEPEMTSKQENAMVHLPSMSPRTRKLVQGGLEKGETRLLKIPPQLQLNQTLSNLKGFDGVTTGSKVLPSVGMPPVRSPTPNTEDNLLKARQPHERRGLLVNRGVVHFRSQVIAYPCPMDRDSQRARKRSPMIEQNLANYEIIEKQLHYIDEEIAREEFLESQRHRRNPLVRLKEKLSSIIAS